MVVPALSRFSVAALSCLGLLSSISPRITLTSGFVTTASSRSSWKSASRTRLRAAAANPLEAVQNFFESSMPYSDYPVPGMKRVKTQFIAALGDPKANSSNEGAEQWGIWRVDPGPRGVHVSQYDSQLAQRKNVAPAGWELDPNEFWIEEYGRIMETPSFPVPPGRYLVTGARDVTTLLTIGEPLASGKQSWKLQDPKATLFDVTHLPCRSARYQPKEGQMATPGDANPADYPVRPGGEMPPIPNCVKQDYAVLFVLAVDKDSSW